MLFKAPLVAIEFEPRATESSTLASDLYPIVVAFVPLEILLPPIAIEPSLVDLAPSEVLFIADPMAIEAFPSAIAPKWLLTPLEPMAIPLLPVELAIVPIEMVSSILLSSSI